MSSDEVERVIPRVGTPSLEEQRVTGIMRGFVVPEFVLGPLVTDTTAGEIELSDALVFAPPLGLILEIKTREPHAASTDDVESASAWAIGAAKKARKQARATRKFFADGSVGLRPTWSSIRFPSTTSVVPPYGVADWPTVVILDHPHDELLRAIAPRSLIGTSGSPTMTVTYSDWARLQERLRSGALLVSYVATAVTKRQPNLGDEMVRLQLLHNEGGREGGGMPTWPSLLTSASEERERRTWRELADKAAPVLAGLLSDLEPYLVALARLDAVPPTAQSLIGRALAGDLVSARRNGYSENCAGIDSANAILLTWCVGDPPTRRQDRAYRVVTNAETMHASACATGAPRDRLVTFGFGLSIGAHRRWQVDSVHVVAGSGRVSDLTLSMMELVALHGSWDWNRMAHVPPG